MKIKITTTFTGIQESFVEVPDQSDLGEIRGRTIGQIIFDPQAFLTAKTTHCSVSAVVEELFGGG